MATFLLQASIFLPGKSYGLRSLTGYSAWGCKEPDTAELLSMHTFIHNTHYFNHFKVCNSVELYNSVVLSMF